MQKHSVKLAEMGAAASTGGSLSTVEQIRSSVLEGRPLDASDIKVRGVFAFFCVVVFLSTKVIFLIHHHVFAIES